MTGAATLESVRVRPPADGATATPVTVPLGQALDPRQAGGKASNLAKLIGLGFPVPAGRVLTCEAFRRFLAADGLASRAAALERPTDPTDPTGRREIAEVVRTQVMAGRLPAAVAEALDAAARELPEGALAVRSSAVGEDGAAASFAGQFDSVLHVTAGETLRRAVRTCWASYWSERSIHYRAARGAGLGGMAVILQRQVSARVSGVLFTRAPAGAPGASGDDLLIECCPGLADGLVSGRVEPERLVVSRAAGTPVGPAPPAGGLLSAVDVRALTGAALRLEGELGAPQDVEWSIDGDGRLWILQSRPITATGDARRGAEPTVIWSNANVNENFPAPICPLLYSFVAPGYYHYFRNLALAFGISRRRLAAMDPALAAIVGVHGGRLYYNLTSIHAVLRMAPFGEPLARAFNQFVGAEEVAPPPPGARQWGEGRSRVGQAAELLRVAASTARQYLFLRRRLEAFEGRADRFAARTHPDRLDHRSLNGLLEDLRSFLDIRFHRWKDASLADAAAMICYALLQRALRRVDTRGGLHNRLLRALPGVPSATPPLRLWALSRLIRSDPRLDRVFSSAETPAILETVRGDHRFTGFRRELDRFLEDWGFRSSAELMLTVPSLQEDPVPVIELLRQYAASDGEPPASVMARQAAERAKETSRVTRTLARRSPALALAVRGLLRAAQISVAYRERARLKQALLYTRLRRVALAIGRRLTADGRLAQPDDVFMLTWQEIEALGAGRAMFPYAMPDLVALRRREHAALGAMRPPATLTLRPGDYLAPRFGSMPREPEAGSMPGGPGAGRDEPSPRPAALSGTGACGGVASGPAAVLGDVRDAARLRGGDVLVTRQTDPGWAPVFGLVSGLVIERGGLLSHGAIVAREFGLPCVIGVENATGRITSGQHVTVDGDRGVCTIAPGTAENAAADKRGAA